MTSIAVWWCRLLHIPSLLATNEVWYFWESEIMNVLHELVWKRQTVQDIEQVPMYCVWTQSEDRYNSNLSHQIIKCDRISQINLESLALWLINEQSNASWSSVDFTIRNYQCWMKGPLKGIRTTACPWILVYINARRHHMAY